MNHLYKQSVAELLGSLIFTFVSAGAICMDSFLQTSGQPGVGLLGIALAHAVGMAIAITMTMNVSGGFANPAITIGLLFVGKLSGKQAWYYIVAQVIGALIAGFFLTVLFSLAGSVVSSTGLGTPHAEMSMRKLFNREMDMQLMAMSTLIELLMTFVLTIAIFGTIIDRRAPKLGGWGVGLLAMAHPLLWLSLHRGSDEPRPLHRNRCLGSGHQQQLGQAQRLLHLYSRPNPGGGHRFVDLRFVCPRRAYRSSVSSYNVVVNGRQRSLSRWRFGL
jgi:glycerol uptake facilitator-like aquaporin